MVSAVRSGAPDFSTNRGSLSKTPASSYCGSARRAFSFPNACACPRPITAALTLRTDDGKAAAIPNNIDRLLIALITLSQLLQTVLHDLASTLRPDDRLVRNAV